MAKQAAAISRWWPLFLISGLGLFFELALIRWVSSEIRLLSYFKNLRQNQIR